MEPTESPDARGAFISTGSLRLDLALGGGGLPRGCLVEIAGPPESGKSSLCRKIAAAAQRQGGLCAWVDADYSFEAHAAAGAGLDMQRILLSQPQYAEQGLDVLETALASGAFLLAALDSLDGLVPLAEINTPLGAAAPASPQTLLARWLPRLERQARQSGTALLITRRSETLPSRTYHQLKANPARLALSLAAGVRLQLSARDEHPDRRGLRVQVTKNQFAPCFKTTELDIIINESINNKTGELIELAQQYGLLVCHNGQYYYQSLALGGDVQAVQQYFSDRIQLAEQLEQAVRQKALQDG